MEAIELKRLILPEEYRHNDGNYGIKQIPHSRYRWFQSENVVCIEHYRQSKTKGGNTRMERQRAE